MIEVKWLVEDGIFHANVKELAEEIKRQGMDCQLIDYKYEFINGIGSTPKRFKENDCVICLGSFQEIDHWAKFSSQWCIWCDLNNFKCSSYLPYFGKYVFNKKYVMMSLTELIRQKKDIYLYLNSDLDKNTIDDMQIFIRPDSGRKSFAGQLFKYSDLDDHFIFDFMSNKNLMVLASSPKENIENEWRFIVADNKVITGSQYHKHNEIEICSGYEKEAFDYAQKVIDDVKWQPNDAYTLDVAKTKDGEFHIVEINSFSCSDPYMPDWKIYVEEISKLALKKFEEFNI